MRGTQGMAVQATRRYCSKQQSVMVQPTSTAAGPPVQQLRCPCPAAPTMMFLTSSTCRRGTMGWGWGSR